MMHPSSPWWERWTKFSVTSKGVHGASMRMLSGAMFQERVAAERLRSERSGDPCRIVIVYACDPSGSVTAMTDEPSRHIMAVLLANLRKTDYVGWYREQNIIGALLTVVRGVASQDGYHLLEHRLRSILQAECPDLYDFLRLQICIPAEVHEFDGW